MVVLVAVVVVLIFSNSLISDMPSIFSYLSGFDFDLHAGLLLLTKETTNCFLLTVASAL